MLLLPGIQGRSSARVSMLSGLPALMQGIVQRFGAVLSLSELASVLGAQHGQKRAEPVPGLGRSYGLGVPRTLRCSRWVNSTSLGGS